jgi:hypothetical protein
MKALFIPVNTEYFEAFKNGSKKIEWRIFGKRWNERVCLQGRDVVISKGYGKKDRLKGVLEGFSKHLIDDPGHIFNRHYGEKAKGQLAACLNIKVTR